MSKYEYENINDIDTVELPSSPAAIPHAQVYQNPQSGLNTKTIIVTVAIAAVLVFALLGTMILLISGRGSKDNSAQTAQQYETPAPITAAEPAEKPNAEAGTETVSVPEAPAETITMPDCAHKYVGAVLNELRALGLNVQVEYAFDDRTEKDYVISQSVLSNMPVDAGQTVVLTVSKGVDVCPYDYSQKLVVTAPASSSKGTATLYEWANGDWEKQSSYTCTVGSNGIGTAKEGSKRTPQGLHHLGIVLSANTLDTNMSVRKATSDTCVVDDQNSPLYNQIIEKNKIPSGTGYDNIGEGLTNKSTYAMIYIEHNGTGLSADNVVKGNGSAMGVRGRTGSLSSTYGDVDISAEDMKDLLKRLDIAKNPMIEIIAQ